METNNDTNFNNNTNTYGDLYEEYYKVSIDGLKFQILKLYSDTYAQYSIIDSRGRDCVHVTIQLRRDDKRVYLSQVTYRPTCVMNGVMSRGLSTVKMVKSLLIHIMRDTDYDEIYFKDKSEIDCSLPEEEETLFKISLGMFSFILNGQTWYQKHFEANVVGNTKQDTLRRLNIELESVFTHKDSDTLLRSIRNELKYYPTTQCWLSELKILIPNILIQNIGKSWRSVCIDLFSHNGTLAVKLKANIGCFLFEIMNGILIELFHNLSNLRNINMSIHRNTIESYSEAADIHIEKDDRPIHIDKKRKEALIKSSMMMNSESLYMVGGRKTLKWKHMKHIPHEYGRNLCGYILRRRSWANKTRRRQR
jgi:hypothetical protein